jgi:hypothetical protein
MLTKPENQCCGWYGFIGSGSGSSHQKLQFTYPWASKKREQDEIYELFLFFWVIVALLDPDPDPGTPLNPDPIRIHNFAENICTETVFCMENRWWGLAKFTCWPVPLAYPTSLPDKQGERAVGRGGGAPPPSLCLFSLSIKCNVWKAPSPPPPLSVHSWEYIPHIYPPPQPHTGNRQNVPMRLWMVELV